MHDDDYWITEKTRLKYRRFVNQNIISQFSYENIAKLNNPKYAKLNNPKVTSIICVLVYIRTKVSVFQT